MRKATLLMVAGRRARAQCIKGVGLRELPEEHMMSRDRSTINVGAGTTSTASFHPCRHAPLHCDYVAPPMEICIRFLLGIWVWPCDSLWPMGHRET